VELTSVQQRTLDELIQPGRSLPVASGLAGRLRGRVESALSALTPALRGLRLSKERLNDLERCEGLFQAALSGERPPFEMSFKPASGTLLHKAVELEIGGREQAQPWTLAERAAARLGEDRRFGPFWEGLGPTAQDELLMETVRGVELFRASFPPVARMRTALAPVTELRMEASFGDRAVILSGSVDLVLHRPAAGSATRLLIDLKSGAAWPEHPLDMRLYALLHTLRFGDPPLRVATLFLASGEWQVEEVTEETLLLAADRVVAAGRTAHEVGAGRPVALTAGPYCAWCPRRMACPAAQGRVA
jgi:hypothetical protein